jgi:Flp pilus assembly protein TadG
LRKLTHWRNENGAAAAELVLILPALILLTLGTINLCFMLYTISTLHYTAERAARCASIQPTVCTAAYIQSFSYTGPAVSPSFALSSQTCGNQVTASGTYNFTTGLVGFSVPVSATACRPLS